MRSLIIVFISVLLSSLAHGQRDSIIDLTEVLVKATRLPYALPGENYQSLDSLSIPQGASLADALHRYGSVYVRQYSPGLLASPSMRGGAAAHTIILWNGMPIMNPLVGQQDLSLIPMHFMDHVSVHQGSGGAIAGNGAVGGVIALSNSIPDQRGWKGNLSIGTGSFQQANYQFSMGYTGEKWSIRSRAFYGFAENNFPYRPSPDFPLKMQSNAQNEGGGWMQEVHFHPTRRHRLSAYYWYQEAFRAIPPLTTQRQSVAFQEDRIARSMVTHTWQNENWHSTSRVGHWREHIYYQDSLQGIDAPSAFRTILYDGQLTYSINTSWNLKAGALIQHVDGESKNYSDRPTLFRPAVFAAIQYQTARLSTLAQIRKEWDNSRSVPFQPLLSVDWCISGFLSASGKIASHFRLPTINDLFWLPGGNPDLLPEKGWSQEVGFTLRFLRHWQYNIRGWHRQMHDYILWSAIDGQSIWRPNNITQVQSYGIEQKITGRIQRGQSRWGIDLSADWTISKNRKDIAKPMMPAGTMLLYIPEWQGYYFLSWEWTRYRASWSHRYTYHTTGAFEKIPSWHTAHFDVSVQFPMEKFTLIAGGTIDNIFDKQYRIIDRRPMPGRSFNLNVNINF